MPKNIFYKLWIGKITILFIVIILNPFVKLHTQSRFNNQYQYLSPLPNAVLVRPESELIIRQGDYINPLSLKNEYIKVIGSKSKEHKGELKLSDDGKTILFQPYFPFALGEIVTVNIRLGIRDIGGNFLEPIQYHFKILQKKVDWKKYVSQESLFPAVHESKKRKFKEKKKYTFNVLDDSLPPDFPTINLDVNNNFGQGEIFAAPFVMHPIPEYAYLMILDRNAIPLFYRRFDHAVFNFKLQVNGQLTYIGTNHIYYELNKSYAVVDSFKAGNGYPTDLHELDILPNGHALLIAIDYEIVRMDTIVAGGDSAAVVAGAVIQELDNAKDVIFQWRSFDHYKITDATPGVDLTAHEIDYVHCNAIEVDTDGNIIISCRHMDEITKINRQTGDIIWRCGGVYCKNNEFTFINDSTGFSHQHDIRRIANGDLTLFDNGNLHSPRCTRVCEYHMDEVNKTMTLVWQYENNPVTYSFAMGNIQRLSNGNSFIGWGANDASHSISEVTPGGAIAWAVSFPDTISNYRAFKFNWQTDYFETNPDTIFFNDVPFGQSDTSVINVINNSDSILTINGIYISDSSFSLVQYPPYEIAAHSKINLTVKFKPVSEGYFKCWIHLRADRYTERIARVLFVHGRTDTTYSSVGDKQIVNKFELYQNYPNPFNPTTKISYAIPYDGIVKLNVYDILGRKIAELVNGEKHPGKHSVIFNASSLPSGVYFYRIEVESISSNGSNKFTNVKKLLLIK